jgi:hypothetical protein
MNYALIIALVVVVVFWRTLKFGYCMDDYEVARRNLKEPHLKPKNKWDRFWKSFYGLYYDTPRLAHKITFTMHLINSLLVYYAFGASQISFFAALLFAIHPAGCQGSIWLSGKYYSASTMILLLMYSFKWFVPLIYPLQFIFGGFNGILGPAVFLITPFWFWALLIPAMLLIFRKRYMPAVNFKYSCAPTQTKKISPWRIMLYFKSLGYYTVLGLFPLRLGVYHEYLYTYGLSKKETDHWHKLDLCAIFGLLVFSLFIWCVIYFRTSPVTAGLFWYMAMISQWCNCPITMQQAIAERFIYLALVGLMVAVVNAIYLIGDPVIQAALLGAIFMGYLVRMLCHIESYKNIYRQIDYNILNFPNSHAAWTWKGSEEKNRGCPFTALEAWFEGWKLRKNDFRLNNNIAVLLTDQYQFDQALDFLKLASENIPPDQKEEGEAYIRNAINRITEMKRQIDLAQRKENRGEKTSKGGIILPG